MSITLEVDIGSHPKIVIVLEKIPCGTSVETQYFGEGGAVVRQDCNIIIDKGAASDGVAGEIGG